MMKYFLILLSIFSVLGLSAQTSLTGKVTDANTGESLIGATIVYGKGLGTATNFDGNYSLELQQGERSIQVSYVGYKAISQLLFIKGKSQIVDFKLKTILLNEVQVVADIARDRETPVAFSTIT